MRWKQTLGAFIWGLIFGIFALFLGGAGHGTLIFYVLAASPLLVRTPIAAVLTAPFFWSFMVFVSQLKSVHWTKLLIGVLLCFHYAVAIAGNLFIYPVASNFEEGAALISDPAVASLSVVALAIYAVGQLVFYRLLFRTWSAGGRPALQGHGV
jgi:hypothetical protein